MYLRLAGLSDGGPSCLIVGAQSTRTRARIKDPTSNHTQPRPQPTHLRSVVVLGADVPMVPASPEIRSPSRPTLNLEAAKRPNRQQRESWRPLGPSGLISRHTGQPVPIWATHRLCHAIHTLTARTEGPGAAQC